MVWDVNAGVLDPLIKENPEEETGKAESGKKDFGF